MKTFFSDNAHTQSYYNIMNGPFVTVDTYLVETLRNTIYRIGSDDGAKCSEAFVVVDLLNSSIKRFVIPVDRSK